MLNGNSAYGNSGGGIADGAIIGPDAAEPWLWAAAAGLASRWAWHGSR